MANYKKITAVYSTGATVYCIVERDVDGYFLTALKTSFADSIAYPAMTEDANIKGLYVLNTNDAAWDNGVYTIAAYVLTGSVAAPASDIMVGCGTMQIEDDLEVQKFAVTNLTNAPTVGDFTDAMKTYLTSSVGLTQQQVRDAMRLASTEIIVDDSLEDKIDEIKARTDLVPDVPPSVTDVKAQVVAALATDTYAEPSAVPAAISSMEEKLAWLFALARNKITQTSASQELKNDTDTATIASADVSDNGSSFVRDKWSS